MRACGGRASHDHSYRRRPRRGTAFGPGFQWGTGWRRTDARVRPDRLPDGRGEAHWHPCRRLLVDAGGGERPCRAALVMARLVDPRLAVRAARPVELDAAPADDHRFQDRLSEPA